VEALFHIQPPEPDDISAGARVPSRQLARFIDRWLLHQVIVPGPDGRPQADTSLLPALEKEGRTLKGDEIDAAFPDFERFVDPALAVATQAAQEEMRRLAEKARVAVEKERDQAIQRLKLSLSHQGFDAKAIDCQVEAEREHYARLVQALGGLKLNLDSVSGFVINR
jgi:ATP-dependent helicase HepA